MRFVRSFSFCRAAVLFISFLLLSTVLLPCLLPVTAMSATEVYVIEPLACTRSNNGRNADGSAFVGRRGDADTYWYYVPPKVDGEYFVANHTCSYLPAGTYFVTVGYKSRSNGAERVQLSCEGQELYTFSTVSSALTKREDPATNLLTLTESGPHTFTWTILSGPDNLTIGDLTLTRVEDLKITASAADASMGTVSGATDCRTGDQVTLTATPNPGYQFVKWIGDELGNTVSLESIYTFNATRSMDAIAVFSPYFYRTTEDYVKKAASRDFEVVTYDAGIQGKYTRLDGTQVGDWISYTIQVPQAGEYDITYKYLSSILNPVVQEYVNDEKIEAPYDLYYESKRGYFILRSVGQHYLEAGENTLLLKAVGKNAGITGSYADNYTISVSTITLTPVTEPEKKPELSRVVNISCVGDSITVGAGSGDGALYSYPARLQQMLGDSYNVQNFGVAGKALMSGNHAYTSTSKYRESLQFNADIVLLMLGTNDCREIASNQQSFKDQYAELIRIYRALPSHPEIYLATSCYCSIDSENIQEETLHNRIVPLQKQVAEENHCGLIDIHAAMEGRYSLMNDGIHPHDEGYIYMAGVFYEALKDVLPEGVSRISNPADYTRLRAAVQNAEKLDRNAYTQGSLTVLDAALEAAGRLADDLTSEQQEEINRVAFELEQAIKGLEPIQILSGDLNGDGVVTVSDVVALRQCIVAGSPNATQLERADLNGDRGLTVLDVVLLRQKIVQGL